MDSKTDINNESKMTNMSGMEGMNGNMKMSMSMTINWNTHCVMFLFNSLHAKDVYQFIFGCIVVILLAIFGQLLQLKYVKQIFIGKKQQKTQKNTSQKQINKKIEFNSDNIDSDRKFDEQKPLKMTNKSELKLQFTALSEKLRIILYYFIHYLISLMMMLLAMTMNGYVIISVALGSAIGKAIVNFNNSRIQQKQQNILQDHCL